MSLGYVIRTVWAPFPVRMQTPPIPVEHWLFQQNKCPKLPLFLTVVTLNQVKLELYFQIFLQQAILSKKETKNVRDTVVPFLVSLEKSYQMQS